MKFSQLLCCCSFALICAAASQETGKPAEKLSFGGGTEENAATENHVRTDLQPESGERTPKTDSADVELPNAKPKSSINQGNPNMYSSPLTSIHSPDSNYPAARSVVSMYPSSSSYKSHGIGSGSYGLGSGSYGLGSGSYGLGSGSYGSYGLGSYGSYGSGLGSGSYGLGSGSYGIGSGSYGIGSGSYGIGSGSYGIGSGSYGIGSGLYNRPYGIGPGSYGLRSVSPGLISSSYPSGLYDSGSESCGQSEYGSLIASNIPTSLVGAIPHRGGVNIAQQIIHKPIITEMQEIIHKPIITELQEIVNKPVISDVQQIIHRPLYTEHIELGPSYHGYQKHIVKQPFYQKPAPNYVHQPLIHAGTINLADEYDHAVTTTTTTHSVGFPGLESSYGLTGASYPASYGSGMGPVSSGAVYGTTVSVPQVASYGAVNPFGLSTGYSSIAHGSSPYHYAMASSAPTSYNFVAPASAIAYSSPNSFSSSSLQPSYGQTSMCNNAIGESLKYRSVEGNSQPKAAEQIMYDELEPYKPQPNGNQQYYDNPAPQQSSEFQQPQQLGRSNEESKKIKIDVDAIANQIEKNPDMKKQLLKIITESMYVSDQSGRKQLEKTM